MLALVSNWILVHGIGQKCCENAMSEAEDVIQLPCDFLSREARPENPATSCAEWSSPGHTVRPPIDVGAETGPADVLGKRPLQLLHVSVTAFRWFSLAASRQPSWCQVEKKWAGLTDLHPTALLWNRCCFEPLAFELVSWAAINNWHCYWYSKWCEATRKAIYNL